LAITVKFAKKYLLRSPGKTNTWHQIHLKNNFMQLAILDTDKLFTDSPDAGTPACICSRCGQKIGEDEVPLRMWTTNETDGEVYTESKEYRYCTKCQDNTDPYAGVVIPPVFFKCDDCGNVHKFEDRVQLDNTEAEGTPVSLCPVCFDTDFTFTSPLQ
jgi:hypothetical protein